MIGEQRAALERFRTKSGASVREYSDGPGHRDRPVPGLGEWLHYHEWRVGRHPLTGAIVQLTRAQAAAVVGGWHPYAPGMGILKARRRKAKADKRRASKARRFQAQADAAVKWAADMVGPELAPLVVAQGGEFVNHRGRQALAKALRKFERSQVRAYQ